MLPIPALALVLALGGPAPRETAFAGDGAQVMDRMMAAMMVKPSGSVDADCVNMMEPHHQGAIEMAELELRYGHDARLKRIAQGIIVEQQQEIAAMRLALGRPLPPSAPTPDQAGADGLSATAAPAPGDPPRSRAQGSR